MKILLADDERMVRLGLESLLCELYPGAHTYIHAKNGQEVVERVKEEVPDIVFIDIKMPIMDGLEAIETCREFNHDTQWVILSGYSDFSFAKQAINLGVEAYLLKPISVEELTPIMAELESKNLEKFHTENNLFRYEISNYFLLPQSVSLGSYPNLPVTNCAYQLYTFVPDSTADMSYVEAERKFNTILPEIRKRLSAQHLYHACFSNNTGEKMLLVINNSPAAFTEYLILTLHKANLSSNYTIYYNEASDIRRLCSISKETIKYSTTRLIKTKELFIKDYDMDFYESHEKYLDILNIFDDLLIQWPCSDKEYILKTLNRLYDIDTTISGPYHILYNELYSGPEVYNLKERILSPIGIDTIPSDLNAFVEAVKDSLEHRRVDSVKNVRNTIEMVCDYLRANFRNEINSDNIDEGSSLSTRYCCRIFKMYTAQTLVDYITVLRIEYSKRILADKRSISLEIVAASVGFNNVRTFSKLFLEYTGVSPSEYQKKET